MVIVRANPCKLPTAAAHHVHGGAAQTVRHHDGGRRASAADRPPGWGAGEQHALWGRSGRRGAQQGVKYICFAVVYAILSFELLLLGTYVVDVVHNTVSRIYLLRLCMRFCGLNSCWYLTSLEFYVGCVLETHGGEKSLGCVRTAGPGFIGTEVL